MGWVGQMRAMDAADRGAWWQGMCRTALESYPVWNERVGHKQGFAVPPDLPAWAQLPVRRAAVSPLG